MAAYGDDANPFADPSVQSAANAMPEEYNPFDGTAKTGLATSAYGSGYVPPAPSAPPAVAAASASPTNSAYGSAYGSTVSPRAAEVVAASSGPRDEGVQLREQNLLKREQLILERERQLEARERQLNASGVQVPNWPLSCYPLVYHDINAEIPPHHRELVRRFYLILLCTWVALFWNWICINSIVLGTGPAITNSTVEILWASIFLVLGAMGSWSLWYRNLYYALRDDSTFQHVRHLFWFFGHWCFCVVMLLGIPSCAAGGLFNMISLFKNDYAKIGLMFLVSMIIWGLIILISMYYGRESYKAFKAAGGEVKAEQEARGAVAGVVAEAAAQQATDQVMKGAYSTNGTREMQQV